MNESQVLQNAIRLSYSYIYDRCSDVGTFFDYRDSLPVELLQEIIDCYSEPHRKFHDWKHISTLLSVSRFLSNVPKNVYPENTTVYVSSEVYSKSLTLEQHLSILAHDLVYDPGNSTNEEQSIMKFFDLCEKHKYILTQSTKDFIVDCVMATKTHEKTDIDDINFVLDLDMSGFAEKSICESGSKLIKAEFLPVLKYDEYAYLQGRSQFLENTLFHAKTLGIYNSYPFTLLNDFAIDNLQHELDFL